jgi:hypothetical protein
MTTDTAADTAAEGDAPTPLAVFLSHASPDKDVAEAICAGLEARGIPCWIAPRDVRVGGADFASQIYEAVRASQAVVVVLTAAADRSEHVLREVNQAVDLRMPLLPLWVDGVTPTGGLRYYLGTEHWLRFPTQPTGPDLDALAARVRRAIAEHEASHGVAGGPSRDLTRPAAATAGTVLALLSALVLLGAGPPWPSRPLVFLLSGLFGGFAVWATARVSRLASLGMLRLSAAAAAVLLVYLGLWAWVVHDGAPWTPRYGWLNPMPKVVGGFLKTSETIEFLKAEGTDDVSVALHNNDYDVSGIWVEWTIIVAGVLLVTSWLALVSTVTSLAFKTALTFVR